MNATRWFFGIGGFFLVQGTVEQIKLAILDGTNPIAAAVGRPSQKNKKLLFDSRLATDDVSRLANEPSGR